MTDLEVTEKSGHLAGEHSKLVLRYDVLNFSRKSLKNCYIMSFIIPESVFRSFASINYIGALWIYSGLPTLPHKQRFIIFVAYGIGSGISLGGLRIAGTVSKYPRKLYTISSHHIEVMCAIGLSARIFDALYKDYLKLDPRWAALLAIITASSYKVSEYLFGQVGFPAFQWARSLYHFLKSEPQRLVKETRAASFADKSLAPTFLETTRLGWPGNTIGKGVAWLNAYKKFHEVHQKAKRRINLKPDASVRKVIQRDFKGLLFRAVKGGLVVMNAMGTFSFIVLFEINIDIKELRLASAALSFIAGATTGAALKVMDDCHRLRLQENEQNAPREEYADSPIDRIKIQAVKFAREKNWTKGKFVRRSFENFFKFCNTLGKGLLEWDAFLSLWTAIATGGRGAARGDIQIPDAYAFPVILPTLLFMLCYWFDYKNIYGDPKSKRRVKKHVIRKKVKVTVAKRVRKRDPNFFTPDKSKEFRSSRGEVYDGGDYRRLEEMEEGTRTTSYSSTGITGSGSTETVDPGSGVSPPESAESGTNGSGSPQTSPGKDPKRPTVDPLDAEDLNSSPLLVPLNAGLPTESPTKKGSPPSSPSSGHSSVGSWLLSLVPPFSRRKSSSHESPSPQVVELLGDYVPPPPLYSEVPNAPPLPSSSPT